MVPISLVPTLVLMVFTSALSGECVQYLMWLFIIIIIKRTTEFISKQIQVQCRVQANYYLSPNAMLQALHLNINEIPLTMK